MEKDEDRRLKVWAFRENERERQEKERGGGEEGEYRYPNNSASLLLVALKLVFKSERACLAWQYQCAL